jgi:ABC-type arginine transport system permease subunit
VFYSFAILIYLVLTIISSFGINKIERTVGQQEPAR